MIRELTIRRYALRDDQWERIKDLLPGREGHGGVTAKDYRVFVVDSPLASGFRHRTVGEVCFSSHPGDARFLAAIRYDGNCPPRIVLAGHASTGDAGESGFDSAGEAKWFICP